MNIFEGARRIAKVFAVLWIIFVISIGLFAEFNGDPLVEFLKLFLGGLAFIGGFTVATGWIVRGFMGIPRGHDQRVEK